MKTQKIAAIDIGSNSIKLAMAHAAASDSFRVFFAEKDAVRLGHETLRERHLSEKAIERAANSIARFRQIAEIRGAEKILAVATASVRAADNQQEFIEKIEQMTGVRVEILSPVEEARLIGIAVSVLCGKSVESLINIDIGGGSTELSLMRSGEPEQLFSMKVGAVGLTEAFLKTDPPTKKELKDLQLFIRSQLLRPISELDEAKWNLATGTSGTILSIGRAINFGKTGETEISLNDLVEFNEKAARLTLEKRKQAPEMTPQRAEILIAGGQILEAAMRALGIKNLNPCEYALREGVIIDYLRQIEAAELPPIPDTEDYRLRGVFAVGRRFNYDERHSLQIAALAEKIFDKIAPRYDLSRHDRTLLSAAALLHDIGYAVAHSEYHKHSLYLIKHSELTGFSESAHAVIANIARYHRGRMPTDKHSDFMKLSEQDKKTVWHLGGILRLADALDKACSAAAIKNLEITMKGRDCFFEIASEADCDFEIAQEKTDMFEAAFDCRVVFMRNQISPKI
ncbi:MAG: Ppx/GppA family phosphatase [Acidobacteriota bacterium]|nr:Ppx/GppA family phosphatase [Acidobacteriota bacterium]